MVSDVASGGQGARETYALPFRHFDTDVLLWSGARLPCTPVGFWINLRTRAKIKHEQNQLLIRSTSQAKTMLLSLDITEKHARKEGGRDEQHVPWM